MKKNDVITAIPTVEDLEKIAADCKKRYSVNVLNLNKLSGKLQYVIGLGTHSLDNSGCRARMTCGNPEFTCTHCYTQDALFKLRTMYPAFHHNFILLQNDLSDIAIANTVAMIRLTWESFSIEATEAGLKIQKLVRINSHGEVSNIQECKNYIAIANACPEFTFGVWTHTPAVWVEAFKLYGKPANMVFGISSLYINKVDAVPAWAAEYTDFTFTVNDSAEYDAVKSSGCTTCNHAGCNSGCHSACYHKHGAPVAIVECLKSQSSKANY